MEEFEIRQQNQIRSREFHSYSHVASVGKTKMEEPLRTDRSMIRTEPQNHSLQTSVTEYLIQVNNNLSQLAERLSVFIARYFFLRDVCFSSDVSTSRSKATPRWFEHFSTLSSLLAPPEL